MKKIYSAIALAAAVAISASAADLEKKSVISQPAQALQAELNTELPMRMNTRAAQAPKKISNYQDICQPYEVAEGWRYMVQGTAPDALSAKISDAGDNQVYLAVAPWTWIQLLCTVDVTKSTLTLSINNNKALYSHEEYGFLDLELLVPTFDEEQNKWVWGNANEVVAPIAEDGSIDFGDTAIMYNWRGTKSYQTGFAYLKLEPYKYFSFNASEWDNMGTATYTDGFIAPVLQDQVQLETECEVFQHKTNRGLVAIHKPYGGVWLEGGDLNEDQTADGYLVVNIGNKDCVLLETLVYSGLTINLGTEAEPEMDKFYMFNSEAYMVNVAYRSVESVIEEADAVLDPKTETLADYLSSYDPQSGKVTIINGMFGTQDDPVAGYVWKTESGASAELGCTIQLPEKLVNSVANVVVDADAPVKMYNLQGMEVKNPAAGELVIIKQGAKVVKRIMK